MYVTSNYKIIFPYELSNTNIKDKDSAAQCYIFKFLIQLKYNNFNHIFYKHFQGSNDALFCISCCNKTFLFRTLTHKIFVSVMMVLLPLKKIVLIISIVTGL